VLYPVQPSLSSQNAQFAFLGDFNKFGLQFATGKSSNNLEQQINIVDNFSHVIGTHQLKFGIDYRWLKATVEPTPYQIQYLFGSVANVVANNVPQTYIRSQTANVQLTFSNWSLYAQDTWNLSRNLTLTYGLRWDYNTAPSSPNGTLPMTVDQIHDLATMQLAPLGTTLWHAEKDDFAPRLGIAWTPRSNLVIRAGAGIFYDLGYSSISDGISRFPYVQTKILNSTTNAPLKFPLDANQAMPLAFTTSPPVNFIAVVDPNHVSPRTYEWNAALEQGFGANDVMTLTYVGAGGRELTRKDIAFAPSSTFNGSVEVIRNAATSSYNGLQAQYRHRISHGLQTLVSYCWSHSIDDVSSDGAYVNVPLSVSVSDRGPSNYDIRHTFSAAVSYYIPAPRTAVLKQIFRNWSTDFIIYARTAPPVNVVTGARFPGTLLAGASSVQRPNVVPGVPLYLYGPYPGGKAINPNAFSVPVAGQGDLSRNALRGFNATQVDFTLRRTFKLSERFSLQSSADFFNIFNHPNFGAPINYMTSPQFGQSTQTLNSYLGGGGQSGGLNPLYQIGGPRSIQLALKLQF
jgi:hypothetical protein